MKAPEVFESATDVYKTLRILGEGGGGEVVLALTPAGDQFAVKYLRPELSDSTKRKRFENELRFCLEDHHPGIVRILDYGTVSVGNRTVPFYVMPVFAGSLRKTMDAGIEPAGALSILMEVLAAVDAAHRLDVVHRDLKPENILVGGTSARLAIADFGIAHFTETDLHTAVETKVADRLANFNYAAPEQRVRGGAVDRRADIFALGLIASELFTRQVPHGAGAKTVGSVAPEYGYLDPIIQRMLQQDPTNRPSSTGEVIDLLVAAGVEAAHRQKVDDLRRKVVPAAHVGEIPPVEIASQPEWEDELLTLTLNRAPGQRWVQRFQNSRQITGYLMNLPPQFYQFLGAKVRIQCSEAHAQVAIDQFKRWAPLVTQEVVEELRAEAESKEAKERAALRASISSAEKNAEVTARLKY